MAEVINKAVMDLKECKPQHVWLAGLPVKRSWNKKLKSKIKNAQTVVRRAEDAAAWLFGRENARLTFEKCCMHQEPALDPEAIREGIKKLIRAAGLDWNGYRLVVSGRKAHE